MIKLKTPSEIRIMQEGGKITSGALKEVLKHVKPGVTTLELNNVAQLFIDKSGAEASFKTVDNYPYATCININEGIVHGLPSSTKVKEGDILSIDLGSLYKGFHTDLSYSLEVSTSKESEFLHVGRKALDKAIKLCQAGRRIGDISFAIQETLEKAGYTPSEMLVGHGIGKELHEDPYVPCLGYPKSGHKLRVGMVLAVEVIYQKGEPDIKLSKDGWTYETTDGSLSGLFEKTVAITKDGPLVLTDF